MSMGIKRGMGKKGQEGMSLGTLLFIILGVVILVVLIVGFSQGFDFIFGKFNLLPGQSLQTVVESCNIAGELKLSADYCSEFKQIKVDGKAEYLNCEDKRVQQNMKQELRGELKCDMDANNLKPEAAKCIKLIESVKGEAGKKDCSKLSRINGGVCIKDILIPEDKDDLCDQTKLPK